MGKLQTAFVVLAFAFASHSATAATVRCASDNGGIKLPAGFCASVFADDLGTARHLVVNGNGDVYVALAQVQDGGGIAALRDTDGDGRADVVKHFGADGGTGIGIHDGDLYFATDTEVVRYKLSVGELLPKSAPQLVVGGFPEQHEHAAKSIAFDAAGHLYVNVGAPSNACQREDRAPGSPGIRPCPLLQHHGGIWQFDADRTGQNFVRDGKRYASGIRNAVAITWHDGLFVAQMGRDQLHENWPEHYDAQQGSELPAEEFLYVKQGATFSWPYCYYDQLQKKRVLMPEYGGDGKSQGNCASYPAPIAAFPGHWAPESVLFYTAKQFPARYRGGVFIAFHGSWNRTPVQAGFKVMFVPFHDKVPSAEASVFADGFAGTDKVPSLRFARFRPMGLAQGADGSLYIGDSQSGRIWKLVYIGKR
ncbi:MAG TPA: sorbosone dehydrogenase [Gammaproteobacteria bacterium]|nr:sorbosone dehydrogenase [Gammaproteobacteria bacterium]